MKRESHPYRSRRTDASRFFRIARNTLVTVGILGILPPVIHPVNTMRFITGNTDCSQSGTFGALRDTDFDSVAIATGGIYIDESGLSQPNVYTARRERAAAY